MNRVYIIIVNWNGWRDTIACLESLRLVAYHDFRIVVCDNASEDESMGELLAWCERIFGRDGNHWHLLSRQAAEAGDDSHKAKITLVDNGANLGFGAGTNVGLRYALACQDAAFCWLLNNDTVVDPCALSKMVERMQQKPDACMCGSTIRDFGNTAKIHALGGARYFRWLGVAWHIGRTLKGTALMDPQVVEQHMDYVVGASLLVRESYLREVGLMAEDYFLFFEEIDWFTRGRGRFSLAYAQDSIVYHRVGASVGTATNPRKKSYCCDYHTLRNRLKFTRRYYPRMLPGIYLVLAAEFLVRLVVGRWDLAAMVWHLLCSNEASQS